VRSYSLSGSPGVAQYRITVKIEPKGAAGALVRSAVQVGDRLQVAAPRGQFTLDESAGPVALVSAGVGVTPVLAMLHAVHDRQSTREVWWLHGARNRAEHLFADEVHSLLATLPGAHERVWYSRPGADDRIGTDYDELGRVTAEGIVASGVPSEAEVYLCGPTGFMDGIRTGLTALGRAGPLIHTEVFGAEAPINPGIVAGVEARAPHQPEGEPGTGPLLSFVRTGLNVKWDETYASILELAEACDVPVRWSCRSGVCHTCETPLLEGAVAYDPEPLESPAEGNALLCCTRPATDLALDL
jgi:ferredoxin-NADP reductase/ferredoxin